MKRNQILDYFKNSNMNIKFKRGKAIKGQKNYVGKLENTICVIQLLGEKHDIRQLEATMAIAKDSKLNSISMTGIIALSLATDESSKDWIIKELKK